MKKHTSKTAKPSGIRWVILTMKYIINAALLLMAARYVMLLFQFCINLFPSLHHKQQ